MSRYERLDFDAVLTQASLDVTVIQSLNDKNYVNERGDSDKQKYN